MAAGAGPWGPEGAVPLPLRRAAAMVFVASLDAPGRLAIDEADAHHLGRVLRLRAGEPVAASDGRGAWRMCRFVPAASRSVGSRSVGSRSVASRSAGSSGPLSAEVPAGAALDPTGPVECVPAPAPALAVGFVPTKGDRPEWTVQKLTELGIDRIVVVASARSVVRWDADRAPRQLEKLRDVGRQAAMQSRQVWLPEIEGVLDLDGLLAGGRKPSIGEGQPAPKVVWSMAVPGGRAPALHAADPPAAAPATGVLIGPEGGWTAEEERAGFPTVGLGPQVLRAETAALAAGALLAGLRAGLVSPAPPRDAPPAGGI